LPDHGIVKQNTLIFNAKKGATGMSLKPDGRAKLLPSYLQRVHNFMAIKTAVTKMSTTNTISHPNSRDRGWTGYQSMPSSATPSPTTTRHRQHYGKGSVQFPKTVSDASLIPIRDHFPNDKNVGTAKKKKQTNQAMRCNRVC